MCTVSKTERFQDGHVSMGGTCDHDEDKGGKALTGLEERKGVGFY